VQWRPKGLGIGADANGQSKRSETSTRQLSVLASAFINSAIFCTGIEASAIEGAVDVPDDY
jgi:hypothetical protein